MKRSKPPKRTKQIPQIADDKKKIKEIIDRISKDWIAEERETSILFEHYEKRVHLETSYPFTARRWFQNLWGDPNVVFDTKADSLKISVPWEYCRKPDLILKKKFREFEK